MDKIVVITGASAGIGLATAKLFAENGDKVYDLSRRGTDKFNSIKCDITDKKSVDDAFAHIFETEGRIDVLINNAGMGISGATENTSDEDMRRIFEVNFFGAIYCIQTVTNYMRIGGGGMIINISSAAAKVALPFQSFYSATKSAFCSVSDSLRAELAPFNIKVTSILPGDVKTEFTQSRVKNISDDPIYGEAIRKSVETMEKDEINGMSPNVIANIAYKLANKKNPPPYVVGGFQYKALLFFVKLLPAKLVVSVIGKMYGGQSKSK